jgi:hypothetical protein
MFSFISKKFSDKKFLHLGDNNICDKKLGLVILPLTKLNYLAIRENI